MWLSAWWFGRTCRAGPPGSQEWARRQAVRGRSTRCNGWAAHKGGAGLGGRGRQAPRPGRCIPGPSTQQPICRSARLHSPVTTSSHVLRTRRPHGFPKTESAGSMSLQTVLKKQHQPSLGLRSRPSYFQPPDFFLSTMRRTFWHFHLVYCRKTSGNPTRESSDQLQVALTRRLNPKSQANAQHPVSNPSTWSNVLTCSYVSSPGSCRPIGHIL